MKIRVGISTCLLGEKVRYDGGHKRNKYLVNTLGQYLEYVPVCPEHECGLGVPRESMRLAGDVDAPRLITTRTRRDLTERMLEWCRKRVRELESAIVAALPESPALYPDDVLTDRPVRWLAGELVRESVFELQKAENQK